MPSTAAATAPSSTASDAEVKRPCPTRLAATRSTGRRHRIVRRSKGIFYLSGQFFIRAPFKKYLLFVVLFAWLDEHTIMAKGVIIGLPDSFLTEVNLPYICSINQPTFFRGYLASRQVNPLTTCKNPLYVGSSVRSLLIKILHIVLQEQNSANDFQIIITTLLWNKLLWLDASFDQTVDIIYEKNNYSKWKQLPWPMF